jgi:hypothetical protein
MLIAQTWTSLKEEVTALRNYKAEAASKPEPPNSPGATTVLPGQIWASAGFTYTPKLLDCSGVQRHVAAHAPELHDATLEGTSWTSRRTRHGQSRQGHRWRIWSNHCQRDEKTGSMANSPCYCQRRETFPSHPCSRVSSYQQTLHGEEAEHPHMTLNMLVDTSLRHAPPETHHLRCYHTTDHSVPTSQSGTSKEENDVEASSSPNQGLGFWYVANISIIFYAPCLFYTNCFMFCLHFMAFLCIFWN